MPQFKNKNTAAVFEGEHVRQFPADIQRRARLCLQRVVAAEQLNDLRFPRAHRLKLLRGDRAGQHGIRINKKWRVCFFWTEHGATDIEIDNHYE